jgi:hypothetical protein
MPKMKYEQKSFSVNVGDTEAYRRNYDKIDWGEKMKHSERVSIPKYVWVMQLWGKTHGDACLTKKKCLEYHGYVGMGWECVRVRLLSGMKLVGEKK